MNPFGPPRSLRVAAFFAAAGLVLTTSLAYADHDYFRISAAPGQFLVVPLGERMFTVGTRVRVGISAGALHRSRVLSACGPTIRHPQHPGLLPAFGPRPTFGHDNDPLSACVGSSGASANLVEVTRATRTMQAQQIANIEASGTHAPALPFGLEVDHGPAGPPSCFSWVELEVDASGAALGAQVILKLEEFPPGSSLSEPPVQSSHVPAAVVIR